VTGRDRLRAVRGRARGGRPALKLQAVPFSKATKKPERAGRGRKPGEAYPKEGRRLRPAPEEIDEMIGVGLPDACPACGGEVVFDNTLPQYRDELIAQGAASPLRRGSRASRVGVPARCGDATESRPPIRPVTRGACSKVGCWCSRRGGRSAASYRHARWPPPLGVSASPPGGLTQAIEALATDAEGVYAGLIDALRASRVVSADETGWRIDAERGWLWVYAGDIVTVYDIDAGRGYEHLAEVSGEGFPGMGCRYDWAPYRRFSSATHQSCAAHLLRRAKQMIADARPGQARTPHALRRLLLDALDLRDRRDVGLIDGNDLRAAIAGLEGRPERASAAEPTRASNARPVKHLRNETDALASFLRAAGTPATNHNKQRAIRPMACNRKHWEANKTWEGARTTSVLGSVCRTADPQHLDPIDVAYLIATTEGAAHRLDLRCRKAPDP